ncbi:sensor histidine kinase [Faecalicatena contorta]|uniref:sensor histidine kinase n=1 Tax=Faecalicatena contorta TaxID=39482 RepID=UPI001F2E34B1|nr:ATP-binding protein [Faecalicatena contorta]MCF2682006.1 two-component sensor histidine kinase [Faecalicatena contorta]
MRKKIQQSMILVITTTLLITYAITTFVVYRQTISIIEDEIRQEADYICAAIDISGKAYLEQMDAVRKNTRVTLIDPEGNVRYDSKEDEVTFQNHKNRPEIQKAIKNGSGQDIRESDTLNQEMFYYAVRLKDGDILRVSRSVDTAFRTALRVLPVMGIIAVVMLIFAWILVRCQVTRLIRPINQLDLEYPLENDVYEELTPLLQRIDRQNKEKDAVANMRKEFSANVSHELKTPLTSISGYAEIMKDGLVKPEDMKAFSERIYNEARRLITLVEDIIKLSKLDEGNIDVEKEEVDLYQLTREICSRLAPQAAQKKVHIEMTGEAVSCIGIRHILDEMIYNICENAIKYNKEGGSLSVWVGNTLQGKKVIVTDTGIGIPEDQKERIFERFYRVDKSHSKETGGTGLGLSIVKHGAMIHDARIKVESKIGKGTKMELLFPLHEKTML